MIPIDFRSFLSISLSVYANDRYNNQKSNDREERNYSKRMLIGSKLEKTLDLLVPVDVKNQRERSFNNVLGCTAIVCDSMDKS